MDTNIVNIVKKYLSIMIFICINPKTAGGGGGQFDPHPLWFFEKRIF